jgi:hypothetical protein
MARTFGFILSSAALVQSGMAFMTPKLPTARPGK